MLILAALTETEADTLKFLLGCVTFCVLIITVACYRHYHDLESRKLRMKENNQYEIIEEAKHRRLMEQVDIYVPQRCTEKDQEVGETDSVPEDGGVASPSS